MFLRKDFMRTLLLLLTSLTLLSACDTSDDSARVVHVTDGDTIQVEIDGETHSVRYIGVNTPEIRDNDPCSYDATEANRRLVEGKTVRLEKDVSDTDQYGRLLRYVYVGDTFVNESLVRDGWAEVVRYDPDSREYDNFLVLEQQAANGNRGCHPTGIFNDGSYTR